MAVTPGSFVGIGRMASISATLTDDATALYPIGTRFDDNLGNLWIYCKFSATTALGDALKVKISTAPTASVPYQVLPTAAVNDFLFGISPLAHTANYFGWVLQRGILIGDAKLVSASVADGDSLSPSATAGALSINTAAGISNVRAVCLIDDTDNTGTVLLL